MHTKGKHAARLPFDSSTRPPAAILIAAAAAGWFASWAALSRDPDEYHCTLAHLADKRKDTRTTEMACNRSRRSRLEMIGYSGPVEA